MNSQRMGHLLNFVAAAIFILLFAIISVPVATRFRLPLEIFLVIGSCIIGLIPGLPAYQIDPMIVFYLFLPPILFHAAYFTSWRDFKHNLRPITMLAFGLVIFTMLLVAVISKLILPGFSWNEAFLLGAIVSPTDASAATTLFKKMKSPRRLVVILEGESLVNDATALILFRFFLAAMIFGTGFSLTSVLNQFLLVTAGGIIVGIIIGAVAVFLLQQLQDVQAETTLTITTAFACYFIGEHLGVSGIIATVVCGIYFGIYFPEIAPSSTRMSAKASWNTLIFIINGFVFTLIGLELPLVISNLGNYTLTNLIVSGVTISLAVLLLRLIWVIPTAHLTRLLLPFIAKNDPVPSWQALFVLSWSGMRGIVSLAAVLSIPYLITPNQPFPHRDLLIFITYCVIVVTLLLPILSLPFFLKRFGLTDTEDKMKEEALARIRSLEGTIEKINVSFIDKNIPDSIYAEVKNQIERRLNVIKTQLSSNPYSTLSDDYQALKQLTLLALQSERDMLLQLRHDGEIHDEVFHRLSDELDLEETRARSLRI